MKLADLPVLAAGTIVALTVAAMVEGLLRLRLRYWNWRRNVELARALDGLRDAYRTRDLLGHRDADLDTAIRRLEDRLIDAHTERPDHAPQT